MSYILLILVVAVIVGQMGEEERERKKNNLKLFFNNVRTTVHAATAPTQADDESTDNGTDIVENIGENIGAASYQDFNQTPKMAGQEGYNFPRPSDPGQNRQSPTSSQYPFDPPRRQ